MNKTSKKTLEYLKLPYTIVLRRDEDGDVIARVKEFEGCVADGQDEMEALGNLEHVKAMWIEACLSDGRVVPLPEKETDLPSGKWLQRVPRSLHKKLTDRAEAEGVSLNQFVTSVLGEAIGQRSASAETKSRTTDRVVGSISALAYASSPSKGRLAIVSSYGTTKGRAGNEAIDLPASIEFAALQIPSSGKPDEKYPFHQRNASGY
jgi:antitoxin HicB